MAILKLIHLPFLLALLVLCISAPFCKAQADAIQIVARAALCLDNRSVMNGCLQSMGINIPGLGNTTGSNSATALAPSSDALAPAPSAGSANATGMCGAPCYGQMMLMMTCVDGILSNLQGYQTGLMQGVQAIFQMSCGVTGNSNTAGGGAGGGASGGAGGGAGSSAGGSQSSSTTNGGSHLATTPTQANKEEKNGIGLTTPNSRFSLIPLLFTVIYLMFCC